MKDFEKAQKRLKNDMIALFILRLIIFLAWIGLMVMFGFKLENLVSAFVSIAIAVLMFVGYNLAKKGTKSAGILGMVVGIFMMFTLLFDGYLALVDFVLGLFVLIHSLKYNKLFKEK